MRTLKVSTAYNLALFMTDSTDHVSGKTGLTLTITASKDAAAFSSITPTVTELANGWYKVALTSSHTDTLGDLALHVTGTGADPADLVMVVGAAAVKAEVVAALVTDTYAEASGVPAATSSLKDALVWIRTLARNKITQTATTQTLRNNADSSNVATSAHSSDGTTFTRGLWS